MQPEKRLILAAALLAVAQQEAKNVKWLGISNRAHVASVSRIIADEARGFVASEGFEEMCESIEIEPERLRGLTPDAALVAYERITSKDWNGETF
jgi:hypothetical protein